MITGIKESKTLTNHILCKCICKFDSRKCNSNEKWNKHKCWCQCKKYYICEKSYIWNPDTCSCENRKYLASIIVDSVITSDEIIDTECKSYDRETNFNEKKQPVKH